MSNEFSEEKEYFSRLKRDIRAIHLKKRSIENFSEAILEATLIVGKHSCKSYWIDVVQ